MKDTAGSEVVGFESHKDLARFGNRLLAPDGISGGNQASERDRWPTDCDDSGGVILGWAGDARGRLRAR